MIVTLSLHSLDHILSNANLVLLLKQRIFAVLASALILVLGCCKTMAGFHLQPVVSSAHYWDPERPSQELRQRGWLRL